MSGINLTIREEQLAALQADLEKLAGAVTSDQLALVMGRTLAQVIRDHFVQLSFDRAHHQSAQSLGAAPTGFYERARQGVQQPELESGGVSVSINKEGLAQRVFGGTISAKPGGYLTIPARTDTYGHRASEFPNLRLIVFGETGLAALVDKNEPAHEGTVYFWLVRSVTQSPDPTVLPSDAEMVDPAIENAQRYIERIWTE